MKLVEEAGHRTVPKFQYQPSDEPLHGDVASTEEAEPIIPEVNLIAPEPSPESLASGQFGEGLTDG